MVALRASTLVGNYEGGENASLMWTLTCLQYFFCVILRNCQVTFNVPQRQPQLEPYEPPPPPFFLFACCTRQRKRVVREGEPYGSIKPYVIFIFMYFCFIFVSYELRSIIIFYLQQCVILLLFVTGIVIIFIYLFFFLFFCTMGCTRDCRQVQVEGRPSAPGGQDQQTTAHHGHVSVGEGKTES